MFDVRFGSGRLAEDLSSGIQSIDMQGIDYPVKIKVQNVGIRLQDAAGSGLNERLKSGEEITISNSAINKLMVSGDFIPDKYALEQNFPNPFNPTTTIRYQLPKESKVVIKIYDVLGSEAMELLNDQKEAGIYEVEFNASNLSSGTYIYRIIAGDFVETKKMILLK